MPTDSQSTWSVDTDERFTDQIAQAVVLIDNCIQSIRQLPKVSAFARVRHNQRYLKERDAVEAFNNFAHYECSGGPTKRFKAAKRRDTGEIFHYIEYRSWTAFCMINNADSHIQWNFAIHNGDYC